MSRTIRIPLRGIGKKLLPPIISSNSQLLTLSETSSNSVAQFLSPDMSLNTMRYNIEYRSFSTISKTYKLELPTKLMRSYIDHVPLVRKFNFSVSATEVPLTKYLNKNSKDGWGNVGIGTYNLYTSKSQIYAYDSLNARKYSSTEKSAPPTGPGLADQIMQSRLKEKSHTNQSTEQPENTGENPKGPKPVSKWQKRGYMAFGIFFCGALVVNGVLFCKYFYL